MGAEFWDRIRNEYARLETLPLAERRRELAALPVEVREEVGSLLEAREESEGFLQSVDVNAGAHIGPYRILEEIGRGGMGVVYRAERVDGEFRQTVALKVAGGRLFAPESARRFIRERQILARIEHPNIVRLLDGGMANGQRYFVMELIDGGPITEYCDAQKLSLDERLRLFEEVCGAIQYAHQRMILHRDLKPGNIWVNRDGVVKVLDFGIAQVLDTESAGSKGTMTNWNPVSLAAASPEQVRGEPLGFGSDVYSLGLLLYEMVAGVNPQQWEGVSMETALRRIFEETPVPPSQHKGGVPGDLDAIVLKALEKAPERRYGSAGELAADIRRLRSGHAVQAVPPSRWYRLRRFALRHRAGMAAAASVAVIAIVAGAGYVRQARVEERRFEDARRLIRKVIFDIQPQLQRIPATAALRKTLIESTLEYLESVSRDAAGNPQLQQELALAYVELARVLGATGVANTGDFAAAGRHLQRAEELIRQALEAAPKDQKVLAAGAKVYARMAFYGKLDARYAERAVELASRRMQAEGENAEAMDDLAGAHFARGLVFVQQDLKKSEEAFAQAAELYRKMLQTYAEKREWWRSLALTARYRAQLALETGRKEDQLAQARVASEISDKSLQRDPASQTAKFDAAIDMGTLASALWQSGDRAGSIRIRERAVQLREEIWRGDPGNPAARERLAVGLEGLCQALMETGDSDQAERSCRRSLELYEGLKRDGKLSAGNEVTLALTRLRTARLLRRRNRMGEGCPMVAATLPVLENAVRERPESRIMQESLKSARIEQARCDWRR